MRPHGIEVFPGLAHTESVGSRDKPGTGAFLFVRGCSNLMRVPWAPGGAPLKVQGDILQSRSRAARIDGLLRDLNISMDQSSRSAVMALMAEGRALTEQGIRTVRRAIRARPDEPEVSRLAARALAAGIDPEDGMLDLILGAAGAHDGTGEKGGGQGEGRHHHGREGHAPAAPEARALAAVETLKDSLVKALRNDTLLTLARPDSRGLSWLYVPFDLNEDGFAFSGYMRILFNNVTARTERVLLELRDGSSKRYLEIAGRVRGFDAEFRSASRDELEAVAEAVPDIRCFCLDGERHA